MVASLLFLCATAGAEPVVLLDAGAEPRAPLRFEIPSGQATLVDIRTVGSAEVGPDVVPVPPMWLTLKFDVLETGPEGVRYQFEVVDARVDGGDPMVRDAALALLKPMVGTRGEATVDALGATTGLHVTPPPGAPPDLARSMDRSLAMIAAPLPVEPVGVGARWTLEQQVVEDGLTVHRATIWTLASREGSFVVLDSAELQTAPPQDLTPGSQILTSFESSGTGRTEIDLRSLVPTSTMWKAKQTLRAEGMVQGHPMTTDTTHGFEMTLTKRASASP